MAMEQLIKLKEFDVENVSVSQCIEFIKIMDILCREQADSVVFYKECLEKAQSEFNPFSNDHVIALNDLSPPTFNQLLVNALHLQKSMIQVALLKYKELNYTKFPNQFKAFDFS